MKTSTLAKLIDKKSGAECEDFISSSSGLVVEFTSARLGGLQNTH